MGRGWTVARLLLFLGAATAYHNETIDDADPRIVYSPTWVHNGGPSYNLGPLLYQTTASATRNLDPATLTFSGTAVYVQSLLWVSGSNFTATVDGIESEPINILTPNRADVRQAIVFGRTGLSPDGVHTLILRKTENTADWDPPDKSSDGAKVPWFNLDAIIITHPDSEDLVPSSTAPDPSTTSNTPSDSSIPSSTPSSTGPSSTPSHTIAGSQTASSPLSSASDAGAALGGGTGGATSRDGTNTASSSPPIGAIVGGVLGAIALIALLLLFLWRRRLQTPPKARPLDPFLLDGTATPATMGGSQVALVPLSGKISESAPNTPYLDSPFPADVKLRPPSPAADQYSTFAPNRRATLMSSVAASSSGGSSSSRATGPSATESQLRRELDALRAQVDALQVSAAAAVSLSTPPPHQRTLDTINERIPTDHVRQWLESDVIPDGPPPEYVPNR